MNPDTGRVTLNELANSLLFYRRRLAERIVVAAVRSDTMNKYKDLVSLAAYAEDLANAVCERLAARETGNVRGYSFMSGNAEEDR